jgi:acyl-CoA thioester hydrolase
MRGAKPLRLRHGRRCGSDKARAGQFGRYASDMAHEYRAKRRVEFSETDMAGIVHFSNFFRYMETAEHAFFRSLGGSVVMPEFDPPLGLPRVHAECDYLHPLRFEDEIEIQMFVTEKKPKLLSYLFRFWKLNVHPPIEVARGKLTVVCVAHGTDGKLKSVAIPKVVADQIEVAPASVLSGIVGGRGWSGAG